MNLRKHMVLLVGGGVGLVLLVIALITLLHFVGGYRAVSGNLESQVQRLAVLNANDPFPAPENVELAKANLDALTEFGTRLTARMQRGQVESRDMLPHEFQSLLEKTVRDLLQRAAAAKVALPDKFAFGFDRYLRGELPAKEDVSRLVQQLKVTDRACRTLFDSGVSRITAIDRVVFERGPQAVASGEQRTGRPGRPTAQTAQSSSGLDMPQDEPGVYERERFAIDFMAREGATWEILNRMARSELFLVITELTLNSGEEAGRGLAGRPTAGAPAPGSGVYGAQPSPAGRVPTREERVIAGREEIKGRIVFDAYRFPNVDAAEAKQEGTP